MTRCSRCLTVTLAAVAMLVACRPEPPSSNPAPRPTEDVGLRPMTSRDGGPAATSAAPADDPHAGHAHGAEDPHAADPHASGTLPAGHPPIDSAPAGAAAKGGPSVSGTLEAAPAVKDRIKGGALYVIARNAKSRQIVAVRKLDQASLPQKFEISGAHAMTAGTPFEGPLTVTARWSQQGDAIAAPGDIEGTATDVAAGATNVKVVLSEVRK